jgi:hypothetical protein
LAQARIHLQMAIERSNALTNEAQRVKCKASAMVRDF